MNSCTSSFERGSSPVVGSSSRSRTGRSEQGARERDLLLHPAREILHGLSPPRDREADALEDLRDARAGLARGHPVEASGVGEVLSRGHLLEEGGLDRNAVHEPANGPRLGEDVVAEDARAPAVVQEQRRKQPHERRLPRAVLAQDGDALAALDRERDVLEDGHAPAAQAAPLPAEELLTEVEDFYGLGHACS